MKKNLLILIMLLSVSGYSQNIDVISKHFTLSLINEGILTIEDIKSDNLYYDVDLIRLELDSIGNYYEDIYFYRFTIGKNKIINDKNVKVALSASSCEEFILAFSFVADVKYRLKGFHGNDLLFLLRDIKKNTGYRENYNEILSDLNVFINDINFKEVYEALINLDFDSPSLKNCKEGKKAHSKNKQ
ncbi:MAG: hypothetical protein GW863_12940 [Flavobacteriales bacterium]|nr:hypothetical protein [Flavobacteriales bacterium]